EPPPGPQHRPEAREKPLHRREGESHVRERNLRRLRCQRPQRRRERLPPLGSDAPFRSGRERGGAEPEEPIALLLEPPREPARRLLDPPVLLEPARELLGRLLGVELVEGR